MGQYSQYELSRMDFCGGLGCYFIVILSINVGRVVVPIFKTS